MDLRFPGQWFQPEAGLHYNWHRHYDPSTGRYTQPDPLGFVDGPSVYGYAGGSPTEWVDPDGRFIHIIIGAAAGLTWDYIISELKRRCSCADTSTTLGPALNSLLGAATAASGPFSTKTRTGVGGGGPSGSSTSTLSEAAGKLPPRIRRIVRDRITRPASRLIPGAAGAIAIKDMIDLYSCFRDSTGAQ